MVVFLKLLGQMSLVMAFLLACGALYTQFGGTPLIRDGTPLYIADAGISAAFIQGVLSFGAAAILEHLNRSE